ncbi:MAG: hypothetical protein A2Y51_00485 [Gallionellales bacterium RIFCSPLOWO2_02_60_31]|nr:MAG: hypothetical protein A2Y51_00485 [Gallionellales bacterium RIFCSPLOWO2_02_60_31]
MLLIQADNIVRHPIRGVPILHKSIAHLLPEQLATQARLKHQRRHILISQRSFITFFIELPVILKRFDTLDNLGHLLVTDCQACSLGALDQQALRNQIVHHCMLHFGIIKQRRIKIGTQHLAQTILLLAQRIFKLLLGNLCIVHRSGHFCRIPGLVI